MFKHNEEMSSKGTETVIGPTVKVDGNFVGAGDVIVAGHVSGTMKTSKNLRVSEGAVIKADVEAANVWVGGEIRGHIKCAGKVELSPTAKVFGNVETQLIAVSHGAVLHGKVTMSGHDNAPEVKEVK